MSNSIPASQLVSVIPGVLGAGGNALSLNSVFLTQDTSIPLGTVMPFATAADVSAWFGPNSAEAQYAAIYFSGFIGANTLPGTLYFAQYNTAAVGAYLRGGSVAGLTLAQLQAISGNLDVTIDGRPVLGASVNLSSATSFSDAASQISAGLAAGTVFSGTASQAAGVVTISATASGFLKVGDTIAGTGVEPSSTVVSFGTYTAQSGVGTVNVSTSGTVTSGTATVAGIGTCSYDSLRKAFVISSPDTGATATIGYGTGTLAPLLFLTAATGAATSQGAAATTPAALMASVVAATQNFATYMTVDEVTDDVKLEFAAFANSTNQRYLYVVQDSNAAVLLPNASSSFGVLTAAYNGVMPVYDSTGGTLAAFICGTAASIDFTETAGRITFAYKGNLQVVPQITNATTADNLIANGYNFYGAYATADQAFQLLQPGLVSGAWEWADAYINQIKLNSDLQLALLELLANTKSIPYNAAGYGLIRSACLDPITSALTFGSIQPGVALSAAQAAEVNTAAGVKISDTLQNVGWYLQILPASAPTRSARTSPPMTLWYADGGSVQKLNLASIDVQ